MEAMKECPRCGRHGVCTERTVSKGVVTSVKYRCQVCGPVKPGDKRETVTTILRALDGR